MEPLVRGGVGLGLGLGLGFGFGFGFGLGFGLGTLTLTLTLSRGASACACVGGFLATQTGPNVRSTLVNVTQSEQRGLAFAAFALADDLGKGFGPVVIATLVARLGRERAFAYSMLGWLPCAGLCAATMLTVEADERRARAGAKRALSRLPKGGAFQV